MIIIQANEKRCTKCNEVFLATTEFFHRASSGRDGLHSQCKVCRLKARKKRYVEQKSTGEAQQHYKNNRLKYILNSLNKRSDEKLHIKEIELRLEMFRDANDVLHCVYCGRAMEDEAEFLHIDHCIPISNGGTNNINNIMPTCKYCNRSKWDEDFTYWYRNQVFYDSENEENILSLLNGS